MNHYFRRAIRPLLLILVATAASACCFHPHFGRGYAYGGGCHGGGHYHFRHCR